MRKRWHVKVPEQHTWLCQVLRGHYGYYGVIFNGRSLSQFYQLVMRMWFKALRRRSRKSRLNWSRFNQMLEVFALPQPARRLSEEPGALTAHARICGGESQ